tara:strand:+ start:454 stop:651 length:198 start_codon:yes stop_codon:yes gene_type:complete
MSYYIKELKKSAESGEAKAQYYMGEAYSKGNGVAQDDVQAVYWFKKAAESFHDELKSKLKLNCQE